MSFFIITVSNMAEENRQAAAAQDQNAHFQQEIAAAFTQLTAQIGALSNSFGNASIGQFITPFDGKNSKDFHPWVKQVEKFCKLTDVGANNVKLVAYNGSRDAVSNFLARYMAQFPSATWDMIKIELSRRFSTIIDPSHASCLLRRIHQKESESVQSYAERLIDLAEQASTGLDNAAQQAMATQLVGYFIDGLVSDQIKMKLLRVNPPTLDEAVNSAIYEVNLRKRFNLRTTGREHVEQAGHEPMDIGHIRPRRWQTSRPTRNVPTDRKRQVNAIAQQNDQYNRGPGQNRYPQNNSPGNELGHNRSNSGRKWCFVCNSPFHLKRSCPKRNQNQEIKNGISQEPQSNLN